MLIRLCSVICLRILLIEILSDAKKKLILVFTLHLSFMFHDNIHHQCQGNKLENPQQYYQTIHDIDFVNYENHVRNEAVSSAIKSELSDIHFECDLLIDILKEMSKKILLQTVFLLRKKIKSRRPLIIVN